ncbi:MAG: hypothetical protein CYPHOPRED_001129 [Cyphobasidiales sp. Tagirdzhanova-0007]|nr:MAG: hypothetical protein CYPHOPRED_001129 [Cyphobasidiales sp. Tagirdzhanova-0007]
MSQADLSVPVGGPPLQSGHPVTRMVPASTWAMVEPRFSEEAKRKLADLVDFVDKECIPAESLYRAQISTDPVQRWKYVPPIMEELKTKAKKLGLWNLFLSKAHYPDVGIDLTNLEYKVFARYGTEEQKKQWLVPLLGGKIRSSFAMTERFVASSDATNIKLYIKRQDGQIVVDGLKWWISGAGDPRCAVHLVMGQSDPSNSNPYKRQSIVIVPANAPGVTIVRPCNIMGQDDAPEGHMEVRYDNVKIPESNIIAGWGRGFEVIQGRLGPGRIHHCMRTVGVAQRALDLMVTRVTDSTRKTFGKQLSEHGVVVERVALSRMELDQARLLVLVAAIQIDSVRAKGALREIGIAKMVEQAVVPAMALTIIDRAMQLYGAEGIGQDTPLASYWSHIRTLRYADGPDEVHMQQIGRNELKRAPELRKMLAEQEKKRVELFKSAGIKLHL